MGCCGGRGGGGKSPLRPRAIPRGIKEETLLRIPGASAHLMNDASVAGLASGDLAVVRITNKDTVLAHVVRVGGELGWPLTKDEPVVKLDRVHYLFTLPDKDGSFLNYGVSFAAADSRLAALDMFLKDNACFSTPPPVAAPSAAAVREKKPSYEVYWKDYAPRMEDYNGVLAKAIAAGTGEIVKGIFMCSNGYASQVQKGADLIQSQSTGTKPGAGDKDGSNKTTQEANRNPAGEINKSIKRVRKLSEMTEKMSESLLDRVVSVTGSMAAPLLQSKAGKSFLAMVPGQVLLASLDAINTVMEAVEVAERRTLAATSGVVATAVSKQFGESAGQATEDVFATAGHAVGTAWNLFKIKKAIIPSSSLPSTVLKNAVRKRS